MVSISSQSVLMNALRVVFDSMLALGLGLALFGRNSLWCRGIQPVSGTWEAKAGHPGLGSWILPQK